MSNEASYDIEFVEGEEGDTYYITIKNKDGSLADISWATEAELRIKTKDLETERFVAKLSEEELSISSPILNWPMTLEQTSGYTGEHVAQAIFIKTTPNKKRKTYLMSVMVYPKTDPDPE